MDADRDLDPVCPVPEPTIGRIVHLVSPGSPGTTPRVRAAIVTHVHHERLGTPRVVNLCAFEETGEPFAFANVDHADTNPMSSNFQHWVWPARV